MIAQVLLSGGLAIALVFLLLSPFLRPVPKLAAAAVPVLAIVLVWVPDVTTQVAKAVGIGRGADLILYSWVVLTMIITAVSHLRIQAVHQDVTELARRVALLQPQAPADEQDTDGAS